MLWHAAAREAGTLDQGAVIRALDHARLAEGPGGAVEMVPGQHHLRMNMYVAQVRDARLHVVKELGMLDPKERALDAGRVAAHRTVGGADRVAAAP